MNGCLARVTQLDRLKSVHPHEDHWYVMIMAVHPYESRSGGHEMSVELH